MKYLKKIFSVVLVVTLLCTISASAANTETYGKRKFNTVTVPMNGTCFGQVVTANGTIHDDMNAKDLVQSSVVSGGSTVVAAINGMFFNSYYNKNEPISFPYNCPRILTNLVQDGRAIVGNAKTNCVGFTKDGKVKIDVVHVKPYAVLNGSGKIYFWSVNGAVTQPSAVGLITEETTLPYTVDDGAVAFLIENEVVTKKLVSGETIALTSGQNLVVFCSNAINYHAGYKLLPKVGDKLEIKTDLIAQSGEDWSNMTSIVGSGRMLVHNGKIVVSDASYSANVSLDKDPKQNATGVYQRSFIAVMSDETVLLGTGVGSFTEIAEYLKEKGAVDAMSLDGGASSMLYEGGTGFVTSAGRELASVIAFTKPNIIPVNCRAVIDGKEVVFDGFNIGGNNYFKMRDVSYSLSGTEKQFDVFWDNSLGTINLISNRKYTVIGGEMIVKPMSSPDAFKYNRAPIYIDGEKITMTAYNINGNNYFKVRDICSAFDIYVEWDGAQKTIIFDTSKSYIE